MFFRIRSFFFDWLLKWLNNNTLLPSACNTLVWMCCWSQKCRNLVSCTVHPDKNAAQPIQFMCQTDCRNVDVNCRNMMNCAASCVHLISISLHTLSFSLLCFTHCGILNSASSVLPPSHTFSVSANVSIFLFSQLDGEQLWWYWNRLAHRIDSWGNAGRSPWWEKKNEC